MITTLLSFFGNLFSFLGKGLDFLDKRKFENEVKNNYENKKKIDALEDDKKSKELIDESNEKTEKARKAINEVKNANIDDAKLTDDQVKKELDDIADPTARSEREGEIKLAKEIKDAADKKKATIEKDDKFNSGEEITFKG